MLKKRLCKLLVTAGYTFICAMTQAQLFSLSFEVDDKNLRQLARFEEHSRWGMPSMEPGFRSIELTADGCRMRDGKTTDCVELISNQTWDDTNVVLLQVEELTMIWLLKLGTSRFTMNDENVLKFAHLMNAFSALDLAQVPAVSLGSKSEQQTLGGVLGKSYRDYTTRDKVGNAFSASSPCKSNVAKFIQQHGYPPKSANLNETTSSSDCVSGSAQAKILPDTGTILATFSTDSETPDYLHDKTVWFTIDLERIFSTGVFKFDCHSNMSSKFLPKGCRGNQTFDESVK